MSSEKITVFVDGKPKRLFLGLRVRHAIGAKRVQAIEHKRAIVRDADGNTVEVDGALYDGQRLFVVKLAPRP